VAGILLSASAAVAHDFYTQVIRKGNISDAEEVRVSRWATVAIGATAIGLSMFFRNMNVGILSTVALAIAASVNSPAIFLSLFWSGLTTRGAVAGGVTGLVTVIVLTILSPVIWINVLGNTNAIFPYAYPTLFSVAAAFGVTILVSTLDRSERAAADRAAYADQLVRSEIGQAT
jgi:cation/acetate symporter